MLRVSLNAQQVAAKSHLQRQTPFKRAQSCMRCIYLGIFYSILSCYTTWHQLYHSETECIFYDAPPLKKIHINNEI